MTDFANLPSADPASLGIDADRLARTDARMAQAVENGEVPGVTTVLIRHGHVAHVSSHGYLDAERRNPLPIDALFRMYSQTKPVTAALTMQLQEEGVFYVDEPITKWLPEFRQSPGTGPVRSTEQGSRRGVAHGPDGADDAADYDPRPADDDVGVAVVRQYSIGDVPVVGTGLEWD